MLDRALSARGVDQFHTRLWGGFKRIFDAWHPTLMTCLAQDALETTSTACAPFTIDAIRVLDALAIPPHQHEGRHLMIVTEGAILDASDAKPHVATVGAARFSPTATLHGMRVLVAPFSCLLVTLRPNVRAIFPDRQLFANDAMLAVTARNLAARKAEDGPDARIALTGHVWELLAAANRVAQHDDVRQPPRWLTEVCDAVRADFVAPLRVPALARHAGVHPSHLSRAFRVHFGRTLREFHRECRLQAAVRILANSTATISAIAAATGFADHAHLTRAVRSYTGLTPTSVRREARC